MKVEEDINSYGTILNEDCDLLKTYENESISFSRLKNGENNSNRSFSENFTEKDITEKNIAKLERYKDNSKHRKGLIRWTKLTIMGWLMSIIIILLLQGFSFYNLDTAVLCVLLGTTTLNILGLAYIVLKGMFYIKDDL